MQLKVRRYASLEAAKTEAVETVEARAADLTRRIAPSHRLGVWQAKLDEAKNPHGRNPWLEEEAVLRGQSVEELAASVLAADARTQAELRRVEMLRLNALAAIQSALTTRDVFYRKKEALAVLQAT